MEAITNGFSSENLTIMPQETDDIQAVAKLGEARDAIVKELRKTIMGMDGEEYLIHIWTVTEEAKKKYAGK